MDKIYNVKRKQIGSNIEQFEANQDQVSDTSTVFPEEIRSTRYHRKNNRKIWNYLELLFSMLVDSFSRKYPLPKKTALVMTFSLLYLISPIDISPDILPLIGFADDIAVLAFAFSLIKDDLENYSAWKMSN
jgi:uncharacterized membrane protein YkvA (DUF1232 family)